MRTNILKGWGKDNNTSRTQFVPPLFTPFPPLDNPVTLNITVFLLNLYTKSRWKRSSNYWSISSTIFMGTLGQNLSCFDYIFLFFPMSSLLQLLGPTWKTSFPYIPLLLVFLL